MSIKNNGYRHSYAECEYMTRKAVGMAARSLDMTHPSAQFKWATYAESMLKHWDREQINYQLLMELERDVINYCHMEIVDYVNFYSKGGH